MTWTIYFKHRAHRIVNNLVKSLTAITVNVIVIICAVSVCLDTSCYDFSMIIMFTLKFFLPLFSFLNKQIGS